jgi:hypothetical protein
MNIKDSDHFESDDDTFGELLRSAGRGPQLSDDARARIRASVEATWRQTLERDSARPRVASAATRSRRGSITTARAGNWRRRARWLAPALAASVAVVVATVVFNGPTLVAPGGAPEFATIAVADGGISLVRDGQRQRLEGSAAPRVGDRIETSANGRLALRLADGNELRLNNGTTIEITASTSVDLIAGMLYFDARPNAPRSEFTVATNFGTVEHVGTQYIAALADDGLVVRVREGEARVLTEAIDGTGQEAHSAVAGQQLTLNENGSADVAPFATDHPDWAWAQNLARTRFDGPRTVLALLEWAARETGREVRIDSDTTRESAAGVTLNQVVEGLSPADLLTVIRSTTNFDVSESATTLTVAMR